jgi:hypothetical protein
MGMARQSLAKRLDGEIDFSHREIRQFSAVVGITPAEIFFNTAA